MTAQAFGPAEPADQRMRIVPAPERLLVVPGFEDLVYEARPLLVVPDSRGRVLNWIHALAQPWYAAIVVLTSQAITAATCGGGASTRSPRRPVYITLANSSSGGDRHFSLANVTW